MRCIKCRGKASVELRRHNSAFCSPHYLEFVQNQLRRNVKRLQMFGSEDRILVAVSGGEDSLALWDLLLEEGYSASGLYIHLGIGEYSVRSAEATRKFAQFRSAELIEFSLEEKLGMGVPLLSRVLRRAPCSGCGLNKRYLFNKIALERGYSVVATGHNLDDEAATLMGNVLRWQRDLLARQSPALESNHPQMVRKVKPLYTLTERETASYCLLKGIDYVVEECPNAKGAHSLLYKDILNRIETESPGTKQQFFQGFLSRMRPALQREEAVDLAACVQCGQPTTGEVCSYCRMKDRARSHVATSQAGGERNRST